MATHNTSLSRGAARPLRRRAAGLLAALSVILMSGGLVSLTTPAATATPGNDDNVTICHDVQGNGNTGNGYTIETVDPDSIIKVNGHNSHAGDIIPAFHYDFIQGKNHIVGDYPGKNTDKTTWLNNACSAPTESVKCPVGSTRAGDPINGQPCSKPDKVVVTDHDGVPDCFKRSVETFRTTTTTTYGFVNGAWAANAPTSSTVTTGYRDVTAEECPTQKPAVSPLTPTATAPSCTMAGTLVVPSQPAGVLTSGGGTNDAGPGTYEFSFSPDDDHVFAQGFTNPTTVSVTVLPKLTADCGEAPPVTPTDVCANVDGIQASVPAGYTAGPNNTCVQNQNPPVTPTDVCANVDGIQASVPAGYTAGPNNTCVQNQNPPVTPTDVCANVDVLQPTVPTDYTAANGVCGEVEGIDESTSPPASNPSKPSKPSKPAKNGTDAEVQGVDTLRPVPSIQGVSNVRNTAAVPLAVDAGLAGADPDSRTLLAQSLLGAGLMLLVAAGCSVGLVRRRDGVDVA